MSAFYIDQHGCAKNQVDGEEISSRLIAAGFSAAASPEDADIIIVNTCGFIEEAKKESIGAIVDIKRRWPEKKVIAAGCLSQRYSDALFNDLLEADGVFGNGDLSLIPEAVEKIARGNGRILLATSQQSVMPPSYYPRTTLFDYPGTAHIKITEGCSNHCSYCAIPLIRGELRSRRTEDIVAEARALIDRGIFELVLVGQDLGNYGKDIAGRCTLPDLLASLAGLRGDFRVRVLYIHPDHFPYEILPIIKDDRRFSPYFDLPFQHASSDVLRNMGRQGSAERYLELIARIRAELPLSMIRSTFLVGFPGETEADFAALLDFQRAAQLDWLGTFVYSREENTPAYSIKRRVPKAIAQKRKPLIEESQVVITAERLRRFVGLKDYFIVEETFEHDELSIGRGWMQAPEVDGVTLIGAARKPGSIVEARITSVNGVDFSATLEYTATP
jgi:ribosomal protein S12 methylthiotransferase